MLIDDVVKYYSLPPKLSCTISLSCYQYFIVGTITVSVAPLRYACYNLGAGDIYIRQSGGDAITSVCLLFCQYSYVCVQPHVRVMHGLK